MDFQPKEILTYVIPGIYMLGAIVMMADLFIDAAPFGPIDSDSSVALTLFAVPVIGYILGYILNYLGSCAEHTLYTSNLLSRPSRNILRGSVKRCRIPGLSRLRSQLNVGNDLDNARGLEALTQAKQNISLDEVETFHSKSIFGRNLLTANVLLLIGSAIPLTASILASDSHAKGLSMITFGLLFLLTIILYKAWRRATHVYIKYIFVTYLHGLSNPHDQQHP